MRIAVRFGYATKNGSQNCSVETICMDNWWGIVVRIIQYGDNCCFLSLLHTFKTKMFLCTISEFLSQHPIYKNVSETPCSTEGCIYPFYQSFKTKIVEAVKSIPYHLVSRKTLYQISKVHLHWHKYRDLYYISVRGMRGEEGKIKTEAIKE